MSINIGSKAYTAAVKLRGNPDFSELVLGLGELAQMFTYAASKSPPELRIDATSHARGLTDIWEALESARTDVNPRAVKPPRLNAKDISTYAS